MQKLMTKLHTKTLNFSYNTNIFKREITTKTYGRIQ